MKVKLLTKTEGVGDYEGKSIDEIIVGIARLSSSREINCLFKEPDKLLRHCLWNSHWSIFSMANLTFEIETSRAIGREYLRHFSLSPQELSQRYSSVSNSEPIEIREQCKNNRQSSSKVIDPMMYQNVDESGVHTLHASQLVDNHINVSHQLYKDLQERGVARESARFVLPENTQTTLIMNGKVRDWITTLNQRLHYTAQKEAREVAEAIRDIFIEQCPIISKMLFNFEDADKIHILERILLEKWGVYDQIKSNNVRGQATPSED